MTLRLCIVQPRRDVVSETFLRDQAERLPAAVTIVHGKWVHVGDRPANWGAMLRVAAAKVGRIVLNRPRGSEYTELYLRVLRELQAEAVLAQFGSSGVRVMEACQHAVLPLIVHFHGFDASKRALLKKHRHSYPRLFKQAAAIVTVSRPMQRQLAGLGAPAEKLFYNPCGVDCRKFQGAAPAAAGATFLAVGRFVEKKGPDLTLRAFAIAHRNCSGAHLRMIGDGPLWNRCRELAAQLKIAGAVTFLGPQPHGVVQAEMRGARCFVQHSVTAADGDSEGTPVSILEAGASGLPVVATRHGGIPDVVIEGTTGLLVEERDVHGMAGQMQRLIAEPSLAESLGREAQKRIRTQFSVEQSVNGLWSIIASCVDGTGRRREEWSEKGSPLVVDAA